MSLLFKTLTLVDFKAFAGKHTLRLDINPGLYYVTGKNKTQPSLGTNGVGKSSLFDALLWCLYGKTVRDSRPGSAVENWYDPRPLAVSVSFERDGRNYEVSRSRRPNGLSLKRRGEITEVDQDAVDKALGMRYEVFRHTVLIGQFGVLFLDMGPTDQSALFTEILDLDLWLRASDLASKQAAASEKEVLGVQRQLDTCVGQWEETVLNLEAAKARNTAFEQEKRVFLKEALAAVALARADLADAKREEPLPLDASGPEAVVAGLRLKEPVKPDVEQAQADVKVVAAELRGFKDQLATVGREVVECKSTLRANKDRAVEARNRSERLTRALADQKCVECGQTVPAKHTEDKIKEANEAHTAYAQKAEADATHLEGLNRRGDALLKEIADCEGLLATANKDLQDQLFSYSEAYRVWSGKLTDAKQALERCKNSHDMAVSQWKTAVQLQERRLAESERIYKQAQERVNPHAVTVTELTARQEALTGRRKDLEQEFVGKQAAAAGYRYWVDGFKEIRLRLIDEALEELEMTTNRHAESLGIKGWRLKFATERQRDSGKVTQGFTTLLYPPDMEDPVPWSSYSGGESQRWQLAVTFGISEVLLSRAGLRPNLEILDEPTQHLSAAGVTDLLDALADRAQDTERAIFFIDHHSFDVGLFDGRVYVTHDEDGSQITEQPGVL